MNVVEMYIRVFIEKVRKFTANHIIATDPHNDLSILDMKDRNLWP